MALGDHPPAWTRPFRRLLTPFLTKEEKGRLHELILEAEKKTTGEIHLRVIPHSRGKDMISLAEQVFRELDLDESERRGRVLILVSHLDHRFVVWGDRDIHLKAGKPAWERASRILQDYFSKRDYFEGIAACVREIGAELARHFPNRA